MLSFIIYRYARSFDTSAQYWEAIIDPLMIGIAEFMVNNLMSTTLEITDLQAAIILYRDLNAITIKPRARADHIINTRIDPASSSQGINKNFLFKYDLFATIDMH